MNASVTLALEGNLWLSTLPPLARSELISVAKIRQFAPDERVQGKGDSADGLYGVLAGQVRISATTFAGDEIVFTHLLPGQWFGEIAILDGGDRTHDAHTTEASTLAILPKPALLDLCERYNEVYRSLVALLCEHCRLAFGAIDEFLIYSPEQRMARRLLDRLAANSAPKVAISQEELGALVGISRQSTNKILKYWESRSWVKRGYRGVEITDREALQRLS